MKKMFVIALLAGFAGSVLAQQSLKPEDAIKTRKAAYSFMSWNMGKIKANVDGTFNKEQVVAAANAVAAVANSGLGALFVPGTDKDIGDQKTRLKPEFFQQPDKVKEVGTNFNREANELAKVAATGDVAAIKAQFGKTGATCKACHDNFRKD
ncbi:c-type cytochrome [Propionivibrio dicarboxylicus]|uniref:Cytochrome c556 n=1 Tax=Propionivibrio dicarboxylicus TaxID=83767 RepID=A0A1G8BPV1_9RHOO|nr:cytochrome c [Propionivibrio dicarboxylicus]SDH35068.1 Cytochrome c556 [Propionivibrio dicarboxylicus]